MEKYLKGTEIRAKEIRQVDDLKLKADLKKTERRMKEVASAAASNELLLLEENGFLEAEGMERTFKFQQEDILQHVDMQTANKAFELKLEYGPYHMDYTKNGRNLLIGGKMGHLAAFDCKTGKLKCEVQLKERINAVKWLHNETMFAVAQKKHVYIYDNSGIELHKLSKHSQVKCLEFLPYHFLLASVGVDGILRYQDTSTGMLIAELYTKTGPCEVMKQNPFNAVMNLGHSNGTVTLWSPSMTTPLVKMLCHSGPVTAIGVDNGGSYMVTTGLDGQMKVWDVRTFKPVHNYYTLNPGKSLSISQKGLLAVGHGSHVTIWADPFKTKQKSPYMHHLVPGESIVDVVFCPFEDILGVSYGSGLSTIIVPGSGEPNFDALESNPYETVRQRQEGEVKKLLDKIQPDTISLDNDFIGTVTKSEQERSERKNAISFGANNPEALQIKKKMRGRNSAKSRYLRKRINVVGLTKEDEKEKETIMIQGKPQEKEKDPLHRFIKSRGY